MTNRRVTNFPFFVVGFALLFVSTFATPHKEHHDGQVVDNCWQWAGVVFIIPDRPITRSVPLTSVAVHADVRGWTVGVTAELAYKNVLDENIECQFVFPLADTVAVYQLDADIAGRKLSAQIKERNQAELEYKEAVISGRHGILMESQVGSPDVYRLKLGNLPPNKTALITVSYVQPIDRILDDGLLSLTLPVVLNPRYVPKHQINDTKVMKEKFHSRVPYVAVSEVKYGMTFDAEVTLGLSRQIVEIKSGNAKDDIEVTYAEGKQSATVKLASEFVQDHDFQLLIRPSKSFNKPMVYVEPGRQITNQPTKSWLNYDIGAAWFELEKPSSTSSSTKKEASYDEYWLVIDRSGSMWGEKINDAKSALAVFIKSLPFGCKFNIVGFGSTYSVLFKNGIQPYSEETVRITMEHVDGIEADLGGTEVLAPLQYIYEQPGRNDSALSRRFVVLITDGEVSNTEEVISMAKQNAATTRVFSIGIGEGASTALVNGVARVSNGLSEFVRGSKDRLQAKVISLLKATIEPSAEKINVEWQITAGHVTSTVPKELNSPAVYTGGSISQYAVFDRQPEKDLEGLTKFSAIIDGKTTESRLDFAIPSRGFSEASDHLPLHRLSAKMVLTELTDEFHHNKSEEIRKEAVAISIATGVLCEFTAFVAVASNDDEPAHSTKPPVFIEVERPSTYMKEIEGHRAFRFFKSGRHRPSISGGNWRSSSAASSLHHGVPESFHQMHAHPPVPQPQFQTAREAIDVEDDAELHSQTAIHPASSAKERLQALIKLQTFKGSWLMTSEFVPLLNLPSVTTIEQLRTKIADVFIEKSSIDAKLASDDEFMATCSAVALLRRQLASFKDEWQMIEQKAVAYLQSTCCPDDEEVDVNANKVNMFVDKVASALGFLTPSSS